MTETASFWQGMRCHIAAIMMLFAAGSVSLKQTRVYTTGFLKELLIVIVTTAALAANWSFGITAIRHSRLLFVICERQPSEFSITSSKIPSIVETIWLMIVLVLYMSYAAYV